MMTDRIFQGRYAQNPGPGQSSRLRILDWNIERGMDLAGVMDLIHRERPDVCIFQEVDLNARRTGRRDVAALLASRFGFNYVLGIEFEELSQGSGSSPAYHGNAVFARCDMAVPRTIRFGRQSRWWRPRWYLPRWTVFQPRCGGRMALVVELATGPAKLVIYNVHLESQGCDDLRLWQLSEVVHDSVRYGEGTPVIIAGDFNTRLTPSPLRDYLLASGFRDVCEGGQCRSTKPNGETLDWVFVRGRATCSGSTVHRDTHASDHFPISIDLSLV